MVISRSRAWTPRDVGLLAILLGVVAWMFRAPLTDIFTVALRDEEQSHILLAPLVAIWLVWIRRSRLHLVRVHPSFIGCGVVVAGAFLSWFGFHTNTFIAWHVGALLALAGAVISFTGLEPLRLFGPATGSLAFMLPVPGTIRQMISIPLQSMATNVTQNCLELFGFQAARLGNVLLINGEYIAVAEACNGMRLVFSLGLVIYAFAFSVALRPSMRLLLLALSPVVALVANVLRLIPTSLLYGTTTASTAEQFHDISGWVMLPLALLALLGILKLLSWLELPVFSYRLASQ